MSTQSPELQPSFVEFAIEDPARFVLLCEVFGAIKSAKESGHWQDDDRWLALFDEKARSHFWWPTKEELEDWSRRWFATPVPQRWTDPSLKCPWDVLSMIEAFRNGEYQLLDCHRVDKDIGRLTFRPLAHPFGGTGCMVALLEAFECRALSEQGT